MKNFIKTYEKKSTINPTFDTEETHFTECGFIAVDKIKGIVKQQRRYDSFAKIKYLECGGSDNFGVLILLTVLLAVLWGIWFLFPAIVWAVLAFILSACWLISLLLMIPHYEYAYIKLEDIKEN